MRQLSNLLLILILLLGTWLAVESPATSAPQRPSERPFTLTPEEGPVVVRVFFDGDAPLQELTSRLDVWEVRREAGYLVARVWPEQLSQLRRAGYRVELDPAKTALLTEPHTALPGQTTGIPGYPCYRTVEETFATAEALVAAYPNLATWIDIGDSWEKTVNPDAGYDLMVLRLTNAALPGPKPKLFVMSSVHAREYTPAELSTRFAEHLLQNYDADADVTWLLDHHEIHLLLHANPDGRKWAEEGWYWRKNTNNNYCPNTHSRGADLNRNFEFQWNCCGGSSSGACDETYHGPAPASEPEVQAIQSYLRQQFPDQRAAPLSAAAPLTATGVFLDVHSYSELVLWPWGFTHTSAPNGSLATLGRKLAFFNDYTAHAAMQLYPVDGDTIDFAYGELGLASLVFELGTAFFQDCNTFEETILPDNTEALLYAAKVARTPYQTPAGPDALDLRLEPQGVVQGETTQLTARIDTTRAGGTPSLAQSNVGAAEYYVDAPPWVTTTTPISHTMTAIDGGFDGAIEDATATLDTADLPPGRHTLFVRGRDTNGHWGPFSATFLHVVDPDETVLIDGYVRDASTNAPLPALVAAGMFQTQTNPATGFYTLELISGTFDLQVVGPTEYVTATVEGVLASPTHTTRQDVYLYEPCAVFTDDVESGDRGWAAEPPWAITDQAAHSGTHAWTDSPGGPYDVRTTVSLRSPIFDLSDYGGTTLSFWHQYDLFPDGDQAYVQYSTTGGDDWTDVTSFSGQSDVGWSQELLSLPALDGQTDARLRFVLSSGPWDTGDGWYIDDLLLTAGGPDCVTPLAPTAAFTHTQAAWGRATRFTNLTHGTPPFETRWDFGAGQGRASEENPWHTFHSSGTFTVTLAVTNSLGSATAARPVTVSVPEAFSAVYLPVVVQGW